MEQKGQKHCLTELSLYQGVRNLCGTCMCHPLGQHGFSSLMYPPLCADQLLSPPPAHGQVMRSPTHPHPPLQPSCTDLV